MKNSLSISMLFVLIFTACRAAAPTPTRIAEPLPAASSAPEVMAPATNAPAGSSVLLVGIGMHIEPQGRTHQGIKSGKGDYQEPAFFNRQVKDINAVAGLVQAHGGRMTIQAQSPFTDVAIASQNSLLSDLAASGNEIALHFHEDAHLGKNSSALPTEQWCAVLKEEIELVKQAAGVSEIRYWSGGNLYPQMYTAATCAGLSINSDWKNPQTQTTDLALTGIHPWKPAGGTDGTDLTQFITHDPAGTVTFLPEGQYDQDDFASMRRAETPGGDEAYFDYLRQKLIASLAASEPGKVNVFHFTVHPGEFRGNAQQPFAVIEKFLSEVVDPLVASGQVQWATLGEMNDAASAWETAHPGQDMRK